MTVKSGLRFAVADAIGGGEAAGGAGTLRETNRLPVGSRCGITCQQSCCSAKGYAQSVVLLNIQRRGCGYLQ